MELIRTDLAVVKYNKSYCFMYIFRYSDAGFRRTTEFTRNRRQIDRMLRDDKYFLRPFTDYDIL